MSERRGAARLRAALALGFGLTLSACAQWAGAPGIGVRAAVAQRAGSFALPLARPELEVGDRWRWSAREAGASASGDTTVIERTVVRVAGDQAELRQVALDPATGQPGGAAQLRSARRSVWHLQPNAPSQGEIRALAFPLSIGKTWDYEYRLGGREIDAVTAYSYRAHVDGVETISVPAGRFETLRVTHEGRWSRYLLEEGRLVERSGDVRTTYWYAPAVGIWVRLEVDLKRPDGARELGVLQELVGYRRGAR